MSQEKPRPLLPNPDDVLRKMLSTPPKPHDKAAEQKPKTPKKPAK